MLVSELIPKRIGIYLLFFLVGSGIITGLVCLDWKEPQLSEKLGVVNIEMFDFTVVGNLSDWFLSVLWFFNGVISLAGFKVGRLQDKSGSRLSDIWIWAVFGCVFLSIDSVCQVRELILTVLVNMSGTHLYGDGQIWWIALYAVFFGMIGSRLLVEMRHYLLSCNLFFAAGACQILAICIILRLLTIPEHPRLEIMLHTAFEMFSSLFVLFSFGLYTRHTLMVHAEIKAAELIQPIVIEEPPEPPQMKEPTEQVEELEPIVKQKKKRHVVHQSHKKSRRARWEDEPDDDEYEDDEDEEQEEYDEYDSDEEDRDDDDDDDDDYRPRKRKRSSRKRPKKRPRFSYDDD